MSEEMKLFLLLIECYAQEKERSTADVLREWDAHAITQEIYRSCKHYDRDHMESAFADIDSLMATGVHAFTEYSFVE